MTYWQSLRGRLSLLFCVAVRDDPGSSAWPAPGACSNSNEVSTDVRDRWLPNTRLLGDLNNFTSDYRTAEADSLLLSTAAERANTLHEMQSLDQTVTARAARLRAHPPRRGRAALYRQFRATWTAYKASADQVAALSAAGRNAEAATLYRTRRAPPMAPRAICWEQLTEYNVMRAAQASERSVLAFRRARWLMSGGLAARRADAGHRRLRGPALGVAPAARSRPGDAPAGRKRHRGRDRPHRAHRRNRRDGTRDRGVPQQCDRAGAKPARAWRSRRRCWRKNWRTNTT